MNKQDRSDMAKAAGDVCGSLACMSICFAVFAIALSSSIEYYQVEVLSVASMMVGIALACLFARLTLFLSECQDCTPDMVFKPLVKYLAVLIVVGAVTGVFVSWTYNNDYPDKMCYEVAIGLETGHAEDAIWECHVYRHDIQQILNGALAAFPIFLLVLAVADAMRKILRFNNGKPASSGQSDDGSHGMPVLKNPTAILTRKLKMAAYLFTGAIGLNIILKSPVTLEVISQIDGYNATSWMLLLHLYEFMSILVTVLLGAILGVFITKRYG